jgi:predicted nucleic acid-binding protein
MPSASPSGPAAAASTPAVFDTSPLILLDSLGYLPALRELHPAILIPEAVARELEVRPGRPGSGARGMEWVELREAPEDALRRVGEGPPSLDPGEAAAIAVALAEGATVVVDDFRGRERARRLGVPLTGTLGEILALHRRGLALREPAADLEALRQAGMYLPEDLRRRVLEELREEGETS